MRMILTRLSLVLFAVAFIPAAGFGQSGASSADLPNLYKVNVNLYRGGQPTEAGIRQLKAMGVKTVIDLRANDRTARKEGAWAKAAGLEFVNIPLSNFFGPNDEKIESILRILGLGDNQPVFVHCRRGSDRTGMVIAVYRISIDGWTNDQANAEARTFGFGWWQVFMGHYIDEYYRKHNKLSH